MAPLEEGKPGWGRRRGRRRGEEKEEGKGRRDRGKENKSGKVEEEGCERKGEKSHAGEKKDRELKEEGLVRRRKIKRTGGKWREWKGRGNGVVIGKDGEEWVKSKKMLKHVQCCALCRKDEGMREGQG